MKIIHNGKRYNSAKCEKLAERDHYSHSNNYSGTSYIVRATDGQLLILTNANGQDCWTTNCFYVPEGEISFDGYYMNDEQVARCVELGLIEDVQ